MNENNEQKLNNIRKEKFDIFKLCVDEASKISDRRMKNNQFFIVINGAILSALITFFSKIDDIKTCIALIVASVFGMFLSKFWKRSIMSYKMLNSAKFEVINKMENDLIYKPFSEEWDILTRNDKKYNILSKSETNISDLFFFAYLAILLFTSIYFYRHIF